MASFLQNNGDIILDAVLTDYGRRLLAKGDGSFNIVKFAFGDDEIDYSLFNPELGTMKEDVEIMTTPILEAFTNNAASMKSKLMTLGPAAENILFLPVMKLNGQIEIGKVGSFGETATNIRFKDLHVVPVDVVRSVGTNNIVTSKYLTGSVTNSFMSGVLNVGMRSIVIDQGLDSVELNSYQNLKDVSPMLYETEYNIHVDNRFCSVGRNNESLLSSLQPISIDDDDIATYKLSEQSLVDNISFVEPIKTTSDGVTATSDVIAGIKGSRLKFTIVPNANLLYTDAMFSRYGHTSKLNPEQPDKEFRTLRMNVRIVGVNTGYTIDIPVVFAKVI